MKPFFIPGKTFLFGEYIATQGNCSLVFTSRPCFKFQGRKKKTDQSQLPFHPDSPAGMLYQANRDILQDHEFLFHNPYQRGGLGASTAEFLGLYQFLLTLKQEAQPTDAELVRNYQRYNLKKGITPSGADLIAQYHQAISYYYPQQIKHQKHHWPFKNLSLLLFHTNQKLATHEHLHKLALPKDLSALQNIADTTYNAFINVDLEFFIGGINEYGRVLREYQLEANHTFEIINNLRQNPMVLASKGCGAMGADIFLVLCYPQHKNNLITHLTQQHYPLIATETNLCQ